MRHDVPGLGLLLYGPNGLISSTNLKAKSTGKPGTATSAGGIKMIPLNGTYGRFGLQVQNASTLASSQFTVQVIGSLSSGNPQKLGSSKFSVLVQATSASVNTIKFSTSIIPASWIGVRSSKFSTGGARALQVRLVCVPS